jgi:hypothetical protein
MARELLDAFSARIAERAERRAPDTPLGATARFGWTAGDLAAAMGVSARTARRWRQFNHIPLRRQADFKHATTAAQEARQRARIGTRGLSGLTVQGRYRVSKSVYRTHPDSPVRALEPIPPATMREVLELQEQGELDEANAVLESALSEAYGVGEGLSFEQVDGLDYTIR